MVVKQEELLHRRSSVFWLPQHTPPRPPEPACMPCLSLVSVSFLLSFLILVVRSSLGNSTSFRPCSLPSSSLYLIAIVVCPYSPLFFPSPPLLSLPFSRSCSLRHLVFSAARAESDGTETAVVSSGGSSLLFKVGALMPTRTLLQLGLAS